MLGLKSCAFAGGVLFLALAVVQGRTRAEDNPPTPQKNPPASAKKTKVAVQFTFEGVISEQAAEVEPIQLLSDEKGRVGVRDWVERIEKAAASEQVASVLLILDQPQLSWDHAGELRAALQKVKQAGKPVIAYAEALTAPQFLVAASADKLYLNPDGEILVNGIMAQTLYFKGTLDKLGLQADMLQMGAYKGAAEPLTLTGPSKEVQEMMNWMLEDRYTLLAEQLGQCRGKDAAAGKAWVDGGPYTANEALAAGLVDGLKSRAEVLSEAKKLAGLPESEKLDTQFGKEKKPALELGNAFSLLKIFTDLTAAPKPEAPKKPAVGLIYAEGVIGMGRGEKQGQINSGNLSAVVEKARKDETVKAVVLRINSPGGSALASAAIHDALARLKAEKPLIVSMGGVAASGGYYIAAPAERIFVHPASIVGSIGVVGGKVVLKGLFDWLGVTTFTYKRGGEKTGLFDVTTPFSPAERKWLTGSMEEIYGRFVKVVKAGRGEKLKDFEAKIVGGKIFTGRQAVANGLADELGTLEQALAYAGSKSGLKQGDYEVRVLNKPVGLMQKLLKSFSGKDKDDDETAAGAPASEADPAPASAAEISLQELKQVQDWLIPLRLLHPEQAAAVEQQLRWLTLLQHDSVLAIMPFELSIQP